MRLISVPISLARVASTLVAHALDGQPIYGMLRTRTLARASSAP
jgi:hypothetical protein